MEAFEVSKCVIVLLMMECFMLRGVWYALLLKALLFGNILNCLPFSTVTIVKPGNPKDSAFIFLCWNCSFSLVQNHTLRYWLNEWMNEWEEWIGRKCWTMWDKWVTVNVSEWHYGISDGYCCYCHKHNSNLRVNKHAAQSLKLHLHDLARLPIRSCGFAFCFSVRQIWIIGFPSCIFSPLSPDNSLKDSRWTA